MMNSGADSVATALPALLNDRQFRLWSEMLEHRTGVQIAPDRQDFVRNQISRRIREIGVDDADIYFRDVLATLDGVREWGLMLDRLLVKETRFFRHRSSFDYLGAVLSEQVRGGRAEELTVWSAGCATGEEVYSLAITLDRLLLQAGMKPNYGIIGTDISRSALEVGRNGIYFRNAFPERRVEDFSDYLEPLDEHRVRVIDCLRRRVCFVADNLLSTAPAPFTDSVDAIFCHNVLIYFKRWRRRQVLNRLFAHLKVGGRLILGPGEVSDWSPVGALRDRAPGVLAFIRME